jgi:hypothetical protein
LRAVLDLSGDAGTIFQGTPLHAMGQADIAGIAGQPGMRIGKVRLAALEARVTQLSKAAVPGGYAIFDAGVLADCQRVARLGIRDVA